MKLICVIDTETNYYNELMSVGAVILKSDNYEIIDKRYYVIQPAASLPSMFGYVLYLDDVRVSLEEKRDIIIKEFIKFLNDYEVVDLFAYNALFDQGILSELKNYNWYDIMQVAAYRQYNNAIPYTYECYKTGRLKKNYGVQPIYQMLSGDYSYIEKHNALTDAIDESMIMKMLECDISVYKKIES